MPGLDLRGQNLLLKRMFWIIPPLLVAFIEWYMSGWTELAPRNSSAGGALFIFIVGFAVLAIVMGLGVPRVWMRASDRDRSMLLTGSLAAAVLGWVSMAALVGKIAFG